MMHLYPFLKTKAVILTIFLGVFCSLITTGQAPQCGPVVENFNNTGGSMAGFTSSTQGSTSPGFVYGSSGSNGFLQRCAFPGPSITYQTITPTYNTLPTQNVIGFGFELSGSVTADLVYVFMDYFNVNTGKFVTMYVAAAIPIYSGGVANICLESIISFLPGFVRGNAYRLNLFIRNSSASNANQCIVFDNFRTTGSASQIILPVTFTYFGARKAENGIELIWNVGGEVDVDHYDVEKSTDGRNFTKIGEVKAEQKNAYLYTDKQTNTGVVYYRVRNVDQDGKFSYTKIVKLNLSKAVLLNVFPQPAKNDITVEHGIAANGKITITSANGQVIKTIAVTPGTNQTNINIAALNSGLYIVRFDNGLGNIETLKIVKQ